MLSEAETANFQATLKTEDGNGFCKVGVPWTLDVLSSSSVSRPIKCNSKTCMMQHVTKACHMLGKQYHTIVSCRL